MYGILGQKQYALYYINVREYRRGNQKWTIQRNWQYRVHKKQAENKRQRIPKGKLKMDNPEKLATQGTQDEEKQNKNTTQYVLDTTMREQTQIR